MGASGIERGSGPSGEGVCIVSADSGGHFQGYWVRHLQPGAHPQPLEQAEGGAGSRGEVPCVGNGGASAGATAGGAGAAVGAAHPAQGLGVLSVHQWGAWNEPQDWRFSGVLALAAAPPPSAHCDPSQPTSSASGPTEDGWERPVLYSGSGDRTVKAWLLAPWKHMRGAQPGTREESEAR